MEAVVIQSKKGRPVLGSPGAYLCCQRPRRFNGWQTWTLSVCAGVSSATPSHKHHPSPLPPWPPCPPGSVLCRRAGFRSSLCFIKPFWEAPSAACAGKGVIMGSYLWRKMDHQVRNQSRGCDGIVNQGMLSVKRNPELDL